MAPYPTNSQQRPRQLLLGGATYFAALLLFCLCVLLLSLLTLRAHGPLRWSDYGYSELLISYAGGFIRRGLLGTLLLKRTAGRSSLPLVNGILFWNFTAFAGLLALLVALSRKRTALVALLVPMVPGGLVTMAFGGQFFYRKEIFFQTALCFTACLTRLSLRSTGRPARKAFGVLSIVAIFAAGLVLPFVHEAYLFLTVPAEALLLAAAAKAVRREPLPAPGGEPARTIFPIRRLLFVYVGVEILLFLTMSIFRGDLSATYAGWNALGAPNRALLLGKGPLQTAFGPISWGLPHALWLLTELVSMGDLWYWFVPLVSSFLFCLALTSFGGRPDRVATPMSAWVRGYLTLLLCTFPLFILGWDWGRWIAGINLSFMVIWLALDPQDLPGIPMAFWKLPQLRASLERVSEGVEKAITPLRSLARRHRPLLVVGMVLFGLTLRFPECCMGSRWIFDQTLWRLKGHHEFVLSDANAFCPVATPSAPQP